MKRAILIAAIAVLAGCAALLQPASEEIARGIVKYCAEETPEARAAYRANIQAELPEGHAVHIHCPGDAE